MTMTTTSTTTMMMLVMVGVVTFGVVVTAQTAPVTSPMPTSVMRGVNMFTFSPPTTLGEPSTLAELAEMKALGVEYMPVAIFLRQENATSSRVVVAKKETPTDDALRTFLSAAVAMGIKPMVKPIVVPRSGVNASMPFIDPVDPDEWFSTYRTFLIKYATIAEEEGAAAFSMGVELAHTTLPKRGYEHYWRSLIADVRAVFSGKLTYCSLFYHEFQFIQFWDALDWIGIDAYFPLATAEDPAPPLPQLEAAWNSRMDAIRSWHESASLTDKPLVFTEVGYPSFRSTAVTPYFSVPESNGCTGMYAADFGAQQRAFQALFNAVNANADLIAGVFMFWFDNPSSPDYYINATSHASMWPCWFTPRGKPAYQTIEAAFTQPQAHFEDELGLGVIAPSSWDASAATLPGQVMLDKVYVKNAVQRNATCNDGTPLAYYIKRSPTGSTSWIVYLEGGGLCYDLKTCASRSKILTSSTPWPTRLGAVGIFNNLTDNRFADWNKVIVIYCTSDLYSGSVPQGSGALGWSFQGSRVVPSVLEDLDADLRTGSELLFTGGSAGGVGTFVNYPYVKQTITWMPVRALPDAGWFLSTMPPYSKSAAPLADMLKKGMAMWDGKPPAKCAAALGDKAYLCYSGPVVYNFMPAPLSDMMVCKAQMDAWTVGHDGVKMPLNAAEVAWLIELGAQTRETFAIDKVINLFSADCVYHTSLQLLWDDVKVGNTTLHQAVEQWYFDNQVSHHEDTCTTPFCNDSCV